MPPLYDNIADALVLTADDQNHTVTLDATGATNQNNQNTSSVTGGMTAGIWLKLDLSDVGYFGLNQWSATDHDGRTLNQVHVKMSLTRLSGTWKPYVECIYANNATFDVNNPDFEKVAFGPFWFGGGTSPWGPITKSQRPEQQAANAFPGIYWLHLMDWDWVTDADGAADLTFSVVPPDILLKNYLNPASTTVSVVETDYVQDTGFNVNSVDDVKEWYIGNDLDTPRLKHTCIIPGSDLPGVGTWDCWVMARTKTTHVTNANTALALFINDLYIPSAPQAYLLPFTDTDYQLAASRVYVDIGYPSALPIRSTSDVLAFRLQSWHINANSLPLAKRMKFRRSPGTTGSPIGTAPALATGDRWPLGLTDDNPSDGTEFNALTTPGGLYAQGGEVETIALCECKGKVFLFWAETDNFGANIDIMAPRVHMWNGTTWSILEDDLWGHGDILTVTTTSRMHGSLAAVADDNYAYFIWAESTLETQVNNRRNWIWRCKRYDPDTNTWTELGTGQRRFAPATHNASVGAPNEYSNGTGTGEPPQYGTGGHGFAAHIIGGRLWVSMGEADTSRALITTQKARPSAWYWNGTTWVAAHPPDPSDLHGGTDYTLDWLYGERVFHVDLCDHHADGPNEWPSCVYIATNNLTGNNQVHAITYFEFNGTSWGNELSVVGDDISGIDLTLYDIFFPAHGTGSRAGVRLVGHDNSPHLLIVTEGVTSDPATMVKVDADGNGMTLVGYPGEIAGDGDFGALADLIVWKDKLRFTMQSFGGSSGGTFMVGTQQEIGTRDGYTLIAKDGSAFPAYYGYSQPRFATNGSTLWGAFTDNGNVWVFKWISGGPMTFNKIVPIR